MRYFVSLLVVLLLSISAASAEEKVLLRLSELVDKKVVRQITVTGTSIDPNVINLGGTGQSGDHYKIYVNGRKLRDQGDLARIIAASRRSFSYDSQSGGIKTINPSVSCSLGGPAVGWALETRYLTYKNHSIVSDQMRTVYTRGNCLFRPSVMPKEQHAQIDAATVFGQLQTLLSLNK